MDSPQSSALSGGTHSPLRSHFLQGGLFTLKPTTDICLRLVTSSLLMAVRACLRMKGCRKGLNRAPGLHLFPLPHLAGDYNLPHAPCRKQHDLRRDASMGHLLAGH